MKGKRWYFCVLAAATVLWLPRPAAGQFFNIDVDVFGIPPELGGGVPSSSFGAAAGQRGFWNNLQWNQQEPYPLRDVYGAATSVTISMRSGKSGGSGLGYRFERNTDDFALLLNDAAQVGSAGPGGFFTYAFSGMVPGDYQVYTYAVAPIGRVDNSLVYVESSSTPNPQVVTGPMPGNEFEPGVTHSVHHVRITTGTLVLTVEDLPGEENAGWVNGFQIVPEPSTLASLLLPVVWALARVAKRRA